MQIKLDDLTGTQIAEFLEEHIEDMKSVSPPESKHALDIEGLKKPDVAFWTVWDGQELVGCGAIKELTKRHAEIKSMRISKAARGKGVASMLLQYILDQSQTRGYQRLSLETGSMAYFDAARNLYLKFGFNYCPPFAEYKLDPNSVFMTIELDKLD